MSSSLVMTRSQVLTVRLRATDRVLEAELVNSDDKTRLRLKRTTSGLRKQHFDLGVDVEVFQGGERYAQEEVEVIDFDRDERMIQLRSPLHLKHVRRRANFREDVVLDVRVAPYKGSNSWDGGLGPSAVHGKTNDVGGGGVSLVTRTSMGIGVGDNVCLEIDVEGEPVRAIARTAWVRERGNGRTTAGFAFVDLDDRGHDRLFRFLYALQRKKRRSTYR